MNDISSEMKKLDRLQKQLEVYKKKLELSEDSRARVEEIKEKNQKLLETANSELRETLNDLQRAQDQLILSEKMAALGQLIAGVAHEVNTPLGVIKASSENMAASLDESLKELPIMLKQGSEEAIEFFFELLDRSSKKKPNYTAREERKLKRELIEKLEDANVEDADSIADTLVEMGVYDEIEPYFPVFKNKKNSTILELANNISILRRSHQNISEAVKRAAKVVFALKSYAHFEQVVDMQEEGVIEEIEVVLTLYSNLLKHGITVVKQYGDIPKIQCNPDELAQVWTNIIHNAIQAMEKSGTLTIDVSQVDNMIKISITDTGPGIPETIRDKVFEPFFTTKPRGEGSGLGLHIISRIIEKHQGKIDFTSKPGETTFNVYLPLVQAKK